MARSLTIGEMASRYNVSLRVLRFYEERQLLTPVREGRDRFYSAQDRQRLELILKGKALGFTLRELSAVIANASIGSDDFYLAAGRERIAEQISILEERRGQVEAAISELKSMDAVPGDFAVVP